MLDQLDRVVERPPTASGPRPWPLPTEHAALKRLYLVTRSLDPTGRRTRWVTIWKAALNAFAITFEGRIVPSENN